MLKVISSLIQNVAAGAGEGHAHGPLGDSGTQIFGVIIIVIISSVVFWLMNKKK